MKSYYNDNDRNSAAWIRQLITEGLIPPGDVDDRSILQVSPTDLRGYTQCHFFCGIAGWPLALAMAGVPASTPLWSGSAPCQPFSRAARDRRKGLSDERHLWPAWFRLIDACRPPLVIGEQVADALSWLDAVGDDLEGADYSFWPASIPAYCAGADHERERIYFAAHANGYCKPSGSINAEVAVLPWIDCESFGVVPTNGLPASVAYRGFGNAIVPQVAAEFIRAFLDCENQPSRA